MSQVFKGWMVLLMGISLIACSDGPEKNIYVEPAQAIVSLKDTPVMSIALQEVVDTYVLGGSRTDLQREHLTAKLVGATVSWRFKVYDVAKENGRYRIMSELMSGTDAGAFGKFTVVAFVAARDDQDVQALMKLQTGSDIGIRGRVDSVTFRTALVLSPAELLY